MSAGQEEARKETVSCRRQPLIILWACSEIGVSFEFDLPAFNAPLQCTCAHAWGAHALSKVHGDVHACAPAVADLISHGATKYTYVILELTGASA